MTTRFSIVRETNGDLSLAEGSLKTEVTLVTPAQTVEPAEEWAGTRFQRVLGVDGKTYLIHCRNRTAKVIKR